ncbi:hypothetical protein [Corynebacterium urinipleomorphum]|uniref:hypothetical protein n=1 Tax=Corynebacterium urinipleomorphum TaxID=1852380 RepID=UPI000B35B73C|nr:hypothetical protein [Corynebacterium urinipleomorphum]
MIKGWLRTRRASRVAAVSATAAVAALTLTGCSGNLEETQEPVLETLSRVSESSQATETVTSVTSTTRAADRPVNPADYERAGMSIFTYDIGSHTGTCAISPHGVTCQGATPSDAPMVTAVPLPPRKADAIYAGTDGMHFTVFEGVGPSQGDLKPGQSIRVNENFCSYPDDETLRCSSGDSMSYTISGRDGTITPHGRVDDPPVWTLPDYW